MRTTSRFLSLGFAMWPSVRHWQPLATHCYARTERWRLNLLTKDEAGDATLRQGLR